MQVNIIEEAGYTTALYGFSLSYKDRKIPRVEWACFKREEDAFECCYENSDACNVYKRFKQTKKTATANAGRGMGHDKWLRQVAVWIDIEAPRYFWSEFDTYKVGTVAQSESTMHTLMKRNVVSSDFEGGMGSDMLGSVNQGMRDSMGLGAIHLVKGYLPESYLQRRVVSLNYAVLRCIIEQRKNHKLPEWHTFIDAIYAQAQHPELLPKRD